MNRAQKYFFNAMLMSIGGILIRAVSVAFNVFVSSKVGAEGMGLLTLTSGIYGFSITLATSGINLAVVRLVSSAMPENNEDISKNSQESVKKIMKNAIFYCLFFSTIASTLLFFLSDFIGNNLLNDSRTISSLKLMSFSLVPISISSALNGYFSAVRKAYKNVIIQLLEQGVKIGVITALLITIAPAGLEYACIAVVAGGALAEGFSLIFSVIFYIFDRWGFSKKLSKTQGGVSYKYGFFVKSSGNLRYDTKITPIALPVAISAYFRSALTTVEHLLIPWGLKRSGINSASALASYGILHGMVFPLLLFPSAVLGAFSSLLVPELSYAMASKSSERIKRIVTKVFNLTLFFAFGVSGIFICFSHEIGIFFYGSAEAGEYIRLLSPLIPLMYLDGAVDAMLKGLGEQVYTMRVNIVDSLISVLLIVILLPTFGISGYIGVIFITELINTSFSILKLLNVTEIKASITKWILKPIVSVILATVISRLLYNFVFIKILEGRTLLILEGFLTLCLYLTFSLVTKSLSSNDIYFFKSLFKRDKSKNT